jgi:cyclopropane-fatty-acyl-phospholipid synthase
VLVARLLEDVLGDDPPVRIEAWDGSGVGRADAAARVLFRSPDAFRRIVAAPGELGFARAYVAGDIDVEGDVFAALDLQHHIPSLRLRPRHLRMVLRLLRPTQLRPLPPPPQEARLRGRRHTRERDAQAIAHHYDVGNDFYRLVLGPALTYSCAVFEHPDTTLEEAQTAKIELVCRKLGLQPGDRLLDVGCGWGSLVLHAARHHGVRAVGVTVSREQRDLAVARVEEAGLADRVEIRLQDYRDIPDGPYDAISSIGMFEHVGAARMAAYFTDLNQLLRPGGRLLNHAISRPPGQNAALDPRGFVARYVFPDGELIEVGQVTTAMQQAGFEARHMESLREHYGRTLRCWVTNLEANWEDAVALVGEAPARVWRLYMAGSAVNFETNRIQIHQVLGVKTPPTGASGMPPRPTWDRAPLTTDA